MQPNRAERWQASRARGRRRFILEYGVFRWGVATALFFAMASLLLRGDDWSLPRLLVLVVLALVLFPVGGWFVGGYLYKFEGPWGRRRRG